jgi:hypothetical protein
VEVPRGPGAGVKCTQAAAIREGSGFRTWIGSMYTSPVNRSWGPFQVGTVGSMFMGFLPSVRQSLSDRVPRHDK